MNGEVPEFRDLINQALATHPDIIKEKPALLRKVALVFTEAARILKNDPARGKAILAKEYPNMSGDSNSRVYDAVHPAWSVDGRMTEAQARAVFAYLQPEGPVAINYPSTFTNEFLP
jgi:NitT/TauT family transport system substrate-binding protein